MDVTTSIETLEPSRQQVLKFSALETGKKTLEALKTYPLELIVGAAICLAVSVVSLFILSGAMAVGYCKYVDKLVTKKEKPPYGDLFDSIDRTLPSFVLFLSAGIIFFIISWFASLFGDSISLIVQIGISGISFTVFSIGIYAIAFEKTRSGIEALKAGFNTGLIMPLEFIKIGACYIIINYLTSGDTGLGTIVNLIITLAMYAAYSVLAYLSAKSLYETSEVV